MSYADQIRNEPNAYNMRELIADGIEENKNTADGAVNTATQIGQQAVNIATDKGNDAINKATSAESTASNAVTTANEAKTQVQSNTDQIANIVAHNGDGTKDSEIVDSRHDNISNVSYDSLGKRLDGVSSQMADIPNKINQAVAPKANLSYVMDLIASVTDGSPKDLFYSIAALNSAYPNGRPGTVLVFDSSFQDGAHSFLWHENVWTDLGVYQSNGIAPNSIGSSELKFKYSSIQGIQNVVIDFAAKTITLNQIDVIYGNKLIQTMPDSVIDFSAIANQYTVAYLYCVIGDIAWHIDNYNNIPDGSIIVLGVRTMSSSITYNPNPLAIKSIKYTDGTVTNFTTLKDIKHGILLGNKILSLDFQNKKINLIYATNITYDAQLIYLPLASIDISELEPSNYYALYATDNGSGSTMLNCDVLTNIPKHAIVVFAFQIDNIGEYHIFYNPNPLAIKSINPIIVNNGTDIQNMYFRLQTIKSDKNLEYNELSEKYMSSHNADELFKIVNGMTDNSLISSGVENGQYVFKNLTASDGTVKGFIKTTEDAIIGKQLSIEVTQDDGIPYIGICKDSSHYYMFKYDKIYGHLVLEWQDDSQPGIVQMVPADKERNWIAVSAPYKLILSINNSILYVYVKKDNCYYTLGGYSFLNNVSFDPCLIQPFQNTPWKLGFGTKFENVKTVGVQTIISEIKIGFGSGMSIGADFKPVKYVNGETYVEEGQYIYLTATHHSSDDLAGLSGINIYKLDINSFKIEYTGRIIAWDSASPNKLHGDASATILYDKDNKRWLYAASDFSKGYDAARVYVGTSMSQDTSILHGFHFVRTSLLNAPFQNGSNWDFDFIYDSLKSNWLGVRINGMRYITDDPLGAWTFVTDPGHTGEGVSISRVNGRTLYTYTKGPSNNNLYAVDAYTQQEICALNIDKPVVTKGAAGADGDCWGSIIPVYNKTFDITNYLLIMYSMRQFENKKYSYGDMWIYKADQINGAPEF